MKSRLFTLLSLASLAFALAIAFCWLRSFARSDVLCYSSGSDYCFFQNMRGQLRFARIVPSTPLDNPPPGFAYDTQESIALQRVPGSHAHLWFAGFALVTGQRWGALHYELLLPHWFPLVFAFLLPLIHFHRRAQSCLRHRAPLCPTCSYNLTGNVSGTCPECGTPIPTPQPGTTS